MSDISPSKAGSSNVPSSPKTSGKANGAGTKNRPVAPGLEQIFATLESDHLRPQRVIEELYRERATLENDRRYLNDALRTSSAELGKLRQSVAQLQKTSKELATVRAKRDQLSAELNKLKTQHRDLQQELAAAKYHHNAAKDHDGLVIATAQAKLSALTASTGAEIKALNNRIAQLQVSYQTATRQVEALNAAKDHDGLVIATAQAKLSALTASTGAEIKALNNRIAQLQVSYQTATRQVEALADKNRALIAERDRERAERNEYRNRVFVLEGEERWLRRELIRANRRAEKLAAKAISGDELLAELGSIGATGTSTLDHVRVTQCLFQLLIGRQPNGDELKSCCARLAQGGSYENLVAEILLSPDGCRDRRNRERFPSFYETAFRFPEFIKPRFPIHIVDVGAQLLATAALTMDHVYAAMVRDGRCAITGFEPLKGEALRRSEVEPGSTILPYFIGDGNEATFHINAYNPTSSLLPPNPEMNKFRGLAIVLPTRSTESAKTKRLDDVKEVQACDYLKVDVQGFELKVLEGAARLLENTCAVHLEVEYEEVYLGQALFSDIDTFMRDKGFELIDLYAAGYDAYKEGPANCEGTRLLWNDALYMKRGQLMTNDMLLKAAYIAHVNYRKYDYAGHLLATYDSRAKTDLCGEYKAYFDFRDRWIDAPQAFHGGDKRLSEYRDLANDKKKSSSRNTAKKK